MYNNDDQNQVHSSELNGGANPAENRETEQTQASGVSGNEGPAHESAPRTEPWRETVYRVPPETTYSPNYHSQSAYTPSQPEKKKKKSGGFLKAVALVLVCAIVSTGASVATVTLMNGKDNGETHQVVLGSSGVTTGAAEPEDTDKTTSSLTAGTMSLGDIYEMACEQVVGIRTDVSTTNIFGQKSTSAVTGSGFVISEDGYIMTNYHVIEYAVKYGYELTVMFRDGTSYAAEIIGYESDNDVAVIKIDAAGLSAVTFGNSDNIKVGDAVYAVGNPLGELTYTMTDGIVSATNRIISTSESVSINMFQINAAVNSGNSGGPVYDSTGKVIGIVTAKYSETGVEGLGFAIPINDAYNIAVELIENGYVSGKAYLGIKAIDVEDYVSTYYNLPLGAYLVEVDAGSCAEKAGLQNGDIITQLGSTPVTSVDDLKTALKSFSAGETSTVTVYRSGEYLELSVVFDENTTAVSENQQTQQGQQAPEASQSGAPQQPDGKND